MIRLSVSHHRPTPQWTDRFSDRLIALRPGTKGVEATRQALAAYRLSPGAEPEQAAEEYAASLPDQPRGE